MSGIGLAGIASGVDTAGLVDQLMAIERNKVARQNLRGRGIEAQASGLRDVQSKLKALKTATEALRSTGTWANTQTVSSSDPALVTVERTGMAPAGGYSLQVRQLASVEQEGFTYAKSSVATTLDINGQSVSIPADATAEQLAAAVNNVTGLDAYATAVDADTIVFSGRKTGTTGGFDVSGVTLSADPAFTQAARNAEYSLDGGATWRSSSTNAISDGIVGLNIAVKGVTTTPLTIEVGVAGVDTVSVKGKLEAFVTAYNDLVATTRAKVDEKGVRNPQNTIDAAKGRLFGDSGLNAMLSRLRVTMTDDVEGVADAALNQLTELGITTGKATGGTFSNDAKLGKLQIDQAKLDAVLADPARVRALMGADGVPGFAQKVESLVESYAGTGGVLDERLKVNAGEVRRVKDRITQIESRIEAQEKRLRAQFAAMEKALGLAQTQGNWLAGQIASLPTSQQ